MWGMMIVVYLLGLVATAVSLSRERCVGTGRVVEATWSVLWPVYWGILGVCSFRDRRRSAIHR